MREMKDSDVEWIGEIPAEWGISRLKTIAKKEKNSIVDGPFGSAISVEDYIEEGIPLARITNLVNQKICLENMVYISREKADSVIRSKFSIGDIIFAKTGATVGKSGINETIDYGILASSCIKISIDDCYYNKFFLYCFQTIPFRESLLLNCGGTTRDTINLKPFQILSCPIPPLAVQYRIADYLDDKCTKIDAIITRQQEVIEKLKAYKLSVITEAITKGLNPDVPMKDSGIEWIGEIPENWSLHKICWDYYVELGKMLDAKKITGQRLKYYLRNVDVQWGKINTDDLSQMDFSEEEQVRYRVLPGDLMVCEGGEIGKSAIVPKKFPDEIYYQKALHRIRLRHSQKGNIEYLCQVIYCMAKNNCFTNTPEKATIAHLPAETLNRLRVPFPPQDEQEWIANFLNAKCLKIDSAFAKKQAVIDKLIEYKKSLIYEVVTGKKEV